MNSAGYILGGLIAAEVTGVTDFSGAGGDSNDGGGVNVELPTPGDGGGGGISADQLADAVSGTAETVAAATSGDESGGGVSSDTLAALMATASQSGQSAAQSVPTGGGNDGAAAAIAALTQQNSDLVDEIRNQAPDTSDIPGTGDESGKDAGKDAGKDGGGSPTGEDGEYDLQKDYDGWLGEEVRGGAEILNQTGDVVNETRDAPSDAAEFAGKSGHTFGQAWELVTTGSADRSGTYATQDGTATFDFSGDGEAGGRLTDRVDVSIGDGSGDGLAGALGDGQTAFERAGSDESGDVIDVASGGDYSFSGRRNTESDNESGANVDSAPWEEYL